MTSFFRSACLHWSRFTISRCNFPTQRPARTGEHPSLPRFLKPARSGVLTCPSPDPVSMHPCHLDSSKMWADFCGSTLSQSHFDSLIQRHTSRNCLRDSSMGKKVTDCSRRQKGCISFIPASTSNHVVSMSALKGSFSTPRYMLDHVSVSTTRTQSCPFRVLLKLMRGVGDTTRVVTSHLQHVLSPIWNPVI